MSDHQDILKNSENYHIHLVRWEIDTFSNLFYLKGDPALQFSVEILRADPTGVGGSFGQWISNLLGYLRGERAQFVVVPFIVEPAT